MPAYHKVEVSLNTNAVEVGVPEAQTVNVVLPLVGPTGPQGPAGEGGAIADGDKGDITVSASGATWTIDNNAVTSGKIASSAVTETKIATNAVTNTRLADMLGNTIKGCVGDPEELGNPTDLTVDQTRTLLGLAATDSVTFEEITVSGAPVNEFYPGEGVVNCGKLNLATYAVDLGGGTTGDGFGSIVFGAINGGITLKGPEGDITTSKSISIPNASGTLALTESADNVFRIVGSADATKKVAFEVDTNVPTTSTVALTVPATGGTIARTQDFASPPAIGNTTPNSGAFTTLTANNGTLTASAPVLDLSQTWNASGVTFTGLRLNVTNTASALASWLVDFQIGGSTQFGVTRGGHTAVRGLRSPNTSDGIFIGGLGEFNSASLSVFSNSVRTNRDAHIGWTPDTNHLTAPDLQLHRDAADILAQRRTTNPQAFRLYNTYTDASNYERGFMRWSSNVLQIGTEAAGTGSARDIEFQHGGTTRFSLIGNTIRFATTNVSLHWQNATMLRCFSNGNLTITTSNQADFGLLQFGGTTSSFPALKRSSTALQVRLADDSAYSVLDAQLRAQGTAPATSGAAGTAGDIRYDADYIYVCTAASTWKRAVIATW